MINITIALDEQMAAFVQTAAQNEPLEQFVRNSTLATAELLVQRRIERLLAVTPSYPAAAAAVDALENLLQDAYDVGVPTLAEDDLAGLITQIQDLLDDLKAQLRRS